MKNNNLFTPVITALIFTVVLTLLMSSCSNQNNDKISEVPKNGLSEADNEFKNEDTLPIIPPVLNNQDKAEELPEIPQKPQFINPLTGLGCQQDVSAVRPFAVMMDNVKTAAPQNGISNADIVYEITVEGGITRLLGIFSDYEGDYTIGAVRSSRDYYVDIAQAHGAFYVHAGGSPAAYSTIYSRKINNLDGVNNGPASSFWRDKERKEKRLSSEHTMVTNPIKVSEGIEIKKYSKELPESFSYPLNFYCEDREIEGNSALKININFSSKCALEYDGQSGLYNKFQYNDIHTDRNTNQQISFKNILILSVPHSSTGDEKGRISVNFKGTGKGFYCAGGVYKEIFWKKQDRETPYSLYESDGETPLLLCPGKSYIAIIPTYLKVNFE